MRLLASSLFQSQFDQQGIKQCIVQIQRVGDLVGFGEDGARFRRVLVGQVLEILGDRTVIQVEVTETIDDPGRNRRGRARR